MPEISLHLQTESSISQVCCSTNCLHHDLKKNCVFDCISGRTFPNHTYFSSPLGPGQLALFNLLKAYSLLDSEVGYCQGLSFVAGVLLLHVSDFIMSAIVSVTWKLRES